MFENYPHLSLLPLDENAWRNLRGSLKFPLQNCHTPLRWGASSSLIQRDLFLQDHPEVRPLDPPFPYHLFSGYLSSYSDWKAGQNQAIQVLQQLLHYSPTSFPTLTWRKLLRHVIHAAPKQLDESLLNALGKALRHVPQPSSNDIYQVWLDAMQYGDQQPLLLWLLHQKWMPSMQPSISWPWIAASLQAWRTWAWLLQDRDFRGQWVQAARAQEHNTIELIFTQDHLTFPRELLERLHQYRLLPSTLTLQHYPSFFLNSQYAKLQLIRAMHSQDFQWLIEHWPAALQLKNRQGEHCLDLLRLIQPFESQKWWAWMEKQTLSTTLSSSCKATSSNKRL